MAKKLIISRGSLSRRSIAAMACVAAAGVLAFHLVGDAKAQSPARVPGIKLYVLDGGTLKDRDGVPYGLSREQVAPRDLSDPCVLVVHPRGTLLWETGLNERVNQGVAGGSAAGGPRPGDRVEQTLKSQLAAVGYPPSAITYLALSHSHWDHTGNASDYAGSTWLVQKLERELIFGDRPLANARDFVGLEDAPTRILEGDHDVFGDGTVMLVFTPGHTPGHQALFVKLPKTGPVLLSGDLYHFPEELTLEPTRTGRTAEQTKASMDKVQALMSTTGATLWIQHDARGYRTLKKSPAYYD
jgi:glyoxylase-like metal-dependent hydrolase (beta-lactamase superfamily II)